MLIVLILSVFFVGGGWLAYNKDINNDTFLLIATVVAGVVGVVSLFGLGSLAREKMTADDLSNVQADMVEKVAVSMKSFEDLQDKVSRSKQEVDELAAKRAQIEFLMRQASLKIFLEERLRVIGDELSERIQRDERLFRLVTQYNAAKTQVLQIDGELITSEHADLVGTIMGEIQSRSPHQADPIYLNLLGVSFNVRPALTSLAEASIKSIRMFYR